MNNICSLCDMKIGQKGNVGEVLAPHSIKHRLQDIGLIPGSEVKCVLKSPGGNPAAYLIKGAVIAIRNEDCRNIKVCLKEG